MQLAGEHLFAGTRLLRLRRPGLCTLVCSPRNVGNRSLYKKFRN
jgi:hypothetical protein